MKRFSLAALVWLASCQSEVGSSQDAIIGGTAATDPEQFPTVVSLVAFGGHSCTGTLIAPSVVLTAAHCVDPNLFFLPNEEAVAENIDVVFDSPDVTNPNNIDGFSIPAAKTVKNPDYALDIFSGEGVDREDIGLVFLESPITDRTPSRIDLRSNPNLVGANITGVGYGFTDPPDFQDSGREFFLVEPVVDCETFNPSFPVDPSNDLHLCFDQTDGTGKCNGDSGGPSFLDVDLDGDGTAEPNVVVGLTSFGEPGCEVFGADTKVSAQATFIRDTTAANQEAACAEDGFCFEACAEGVDLDCGNLPPAPDLDTLFSGGQCSTSPQSSVSGWMLLLFALLIRRRRP